MDLKQLGEFGLIDVIKSNFTVPEGMTGIGDDCAVIPEKSGLDTLVSTDMLIEGSHFLLDDITPYRLGWKSAAVNISDIAAMGGRPVASFLSFALPRTIEVGWMEEFIRGYREISDVYGCPLLGGDTTSSPDRLCISVTVLGRCDSGKARRRSDARSGDLICTTGNLGDSGTGLKVILEGAERDSDALALIERHYLPHPRVAEGLELAEEPGVHAVMDISDGIGSDLRHILKASGKGAEICVDALPMSDEMIRCCRRNGWDAVEIATGGGEDYELLFTVSPEAEKNLKCRHHAIGRITDGDTLVWKGGGRDYDGFKHF